MYALCALGVAIAQIISNFFDAKFDAIWLSVAVSACEFLYVIFKFSPSLIPSDSKPFKNPLRQLSREPCSANWMIPKLYVLDELSSFLLPHPTINDIAITAVNPTANTFFIVLIISSPFYLSCTFLQIEKKKSPKQICLRRIIRGTTQIDTRCVHLNHILSYMPTLVTGRVPGDSYLLLSKSPSKVHSPGKSYCNLTTCSSL